MSVLLCIGFEKLRMSSGRIMARAEINIVTLLAEHEEAVEHCAG